MTNETLSIKAVSDRYGISRVTVYRAIWRGDLTCLTQQISGVVINQIDVKEAADWARSFLESRLEKNEVLTKKQRLGLRRAKEMNQ